MYVTEQTIATQPLDRSFETIVTLERFCVDLPFSKKQLDSFYQRDYGPSKLPQATQYQPLFAVERQYVVGGNGDDQQALRQFVGSVREILP